MPFIRRSFLKSIVGGSFAWGAGVTLASEAKVEASHAEKPFVFAFLTDTHLPAGNPKIAQRVAALIDSIQSRSLSPELFVFGGGNVSAVDGQKTSDESTTEQFRQWKTSVMDRLKVPSLSCIGNHDIRWNDGSVEQPLEFKEKARAIETYNMPSRYYSAEHGGWTFLLLDTFQWSGCELDEPQWEWLAGQLEKGETPVCIVTHAPLFSATHFLEPQTDNGKGYTIPAGWSPRGLVKFRELFLKHPRVKLCLSGHMHTCDRVDVDQTSYVCGGAVSGRWWNPKDYLGFGPCWIEVKLYPDGRWSHERQTWS
ncbi:metallophosphoesterase family protein [Planctomicrobium sp. SH527]|uniref:metallophosphoesterase family protein n=1 Tax=Planctomicrobium sp. SH527 TaxID=3448123 RepID=UPI003F5BFD27